MRVFSYSHTEAGIRARAKLAGIIAYQIEQAKPRLDGPTPEQVRAEKRTVMEMKQRRAQAKWEAKVEAERQARLAQYVDFSHLDFLERKTTAREIIERVATFHGFTAEDIIGKRRHRELIIARHDAVKAVAAIRPEMTLPMLAKIFHRDHTTLLHTLGRLGSRRSPEQKP